MADDLGPLVVARRTGSERFTDRTRDLGSDLLSFWRWSASDLVANTTRGVVAEYLVGTAIGCDITGVRDPWAAFDLCSPSGIRVEVKSAAYLQSWHQRRLSTVSFRTRRTRAWDPATNELAEDSKRQAHVYVFALLAREDKATLNPLDASQWQFYVLATSVLDNRTRSQHSITLPILRRLTHHVSHAELAGAVEDAGR